MAKTSAAPTEAYIRSLKTQLQQEFTRDDKQIDLLREVRELEHKVTLEADERWSDIEVRDPALADEIQRVVAALTLNRPKCVVTHDPRKGDKGEENSTLREHWSEEMLWEAGSFDKSQMAHTFVLATDGTAGDGGGWTKFLFRRDRWAERYGVRKMHSTDPAEDLEYSEEYDAATEEAKKRCGTPFAWVHVDVRTLYPRFANGKLREVVEVTKRSGAGLAADYGIRASESGELSVLKDMGPALSEQEAKTLPSTLDFIEHWDDTWATCIVQGGKSAVVVKQFKHGLGRPPYFAAYGYVMNHWRGRKVGWGVAQAKLWLVMYLDFLLTVHADMAARDNKTPMGLTSPEGADQIVGEDGKVITAMEPLNLGDIQVMRPGQELAPINFPNVSPALREQIALIQGRIAELMTPRVKGDLGSGLEGAGFAIAQVLAEAKIYQDPIAKSVAAMLTDVTRFAWHLVRTKVKETVWVQRGSGDEAKWLGAGPDDLTEAVGLQWELDPERATAKLIESRYWAEQVKEGFASKTQAIREQGRNPDEVRFEIDLDTIRQSPEYQKAKLKATLTKLQRGDLLRDAALALAGQVPGMPPGATPPAMGNGVVPDMGALALGNNGTGGSPMPNGTMGNAGVPNVQMQPVGAV